MQFGSIVSDIDSVLQGSPPGVCGEGTLASPGQAGVKPRKWKDQSE